MDKYINKANQARLDEIHEELFNIANSYAGEEYGDVAVWVHGVVCNGIAEAQRIIQEKFSS